uniref:WWE domain-containing protein n=1 Tax=Clytia hemisphaerica TaxID=252671 RepID=A0A7M6DS52_9CNID
MPQKRSQIADDKEENIPAGKRIKTEDKQQESVTWQWEDDGHVWTDFSTDIAKKIQEAFEGKMKKTKIEINDIKFDIIFERMVQRNAKTFWERKMRVVTSENDDGGVSGNYEYEEKKGSWKKYNDGVQRLIHASIAFEFEKVPFIHQRINYTLDLKTLVETNEKKKSKRKIRNNLTIKEEENGEKDIKEEVESEEDGEKDENENTTKTTGGSSRSTATAKKEKTKVKVKTEQKENNSEGDEKTVKSIAFKGKAPVDSECPNKDKYHVYFEGTDIYDAMLKSNEFEK